MKAHEWLNAQLTRNAKEHRKQAERCRSAYSTEPMKGRCEALALAYDEAADAFEKRINEDDES